MSSSLEINVNLKISPPPRQDVYDLSGNNIKQFKVCTINLESCGMKTFVIKAELNLNSYQHVTNIIHDFEQF